LTEQNLENEKEIISENTAETKDVAADVQTPANPETESPVAEIIETSTEETQESTNEIQETPELSQESNEEIQESTEETQDSTTENIVPTAVITDDAPVHNPDTFDWSMDKEGFSTYSLNEVDDLKKLYENTLKQIEEKTVVQGKVVGFTDKDVVLNIGFKSDGLVARTEFRDMPDLKIGDEVPVFVETTEDSLGQLILSHKQAIAEGAWDRIISAMDTGEIVKGYVKTRTKGGLVVDVWGIDAFLPGSQIDVKPIRDYDIYVGQTMEFKIVKINELFKNVVISHKALIEDDIEAQKSEILSRLEKGQVLEGIVKNMTTFGVFIDLGGVDGLLHITDISWGRINHPEEVLTLDEKINIVVLDFDDEKKRISLGLKQLQPHPWDKIGDDIQVGAQVKGKVVTVADYGAFIEIANGIEGLIHVSEMSWSQHLRNPSDFMNVGDEVQAVVLTIDKEEHKLSLGIKQLTSDPWEHIEDKYTVNSKHTGIVRNLTNYGLFVELEEGVDGLVHVSDLSWSKKIKHPAEFTKKGDELEVVVLEIDRENRRLSLGHKQLDENPWETFETIFYEGSTHTGTVVEVNDKGATISLPYGVEGFAPAKHIAKEDKSKLKADEEILVKVIEFGKEQKRIIISHTDIWKQEERDRKDEEKTEATTKAKKTSKAVKDVNNNTDRGTLGDLDALSELKAMMEKNEKSTPAKKTVKSAAKTEVKAVEPVAETVEPANTEAPVETKAEAIAKTKTPATPKEEKPKAKKAAKKGDDLKLITGVGPAFEKRLNALGLNSYAELVALTDEAIAELETKDSMTSLEQWHKWMEEAKALMA